MEGKRVGIYGEQESTFQCQLWSYSVKAPTQVHKGFGSTERE